MAYIKGRKDGEPRTAVVLTGADIPKQRFGVDYVRHHTDEVPGYVVVLMELTPGKMVEQLVKHSRLQGEQS